MALQPNADLRLLNGLLPVNSAFYLSFQFIILNLLISVCTQFRHIFFGCSLSRLPWVLLLSTWLTFLLLPILLTRPIQFNRLILTNESTFSVCTITLRIIVVPTCSVWQVILFRETGVVHRITYTVIPRLTSDPANEFFG